MLQNEGYGAQSGRAIDEFMFDLSAPLKKMKAEWLKSITENCYKEEHISDSFTNVEQINICKQETKDDIFGKFNTMLHNHRDRDHTKFLNCVDDAGGNLDMCVRCMETHIANIRSTNEAMKAQFAAEHKDFV